MIIIDNKMPHTLTVSNNDQNNPASGHHGNHIVKAQLPNQQRTTVSIPAGMTIREALGKALKLRKLEPDMCTVFRLSPHGQFKQRIDWDVDVAMLKGDEIAVETKDRVPMHTQLSHDFAKSYLTLSKCHFCQEFLMTGIRCLTCGIEFHRSCSSSVPKLCEPTIENSTYYRHLLARSTRFSPTNTLTNAESPTNTSRPIRPRARSADENSKHKSKSLSQAEQPVASNKSARARAHNDQHHGTQAGPWNSQRSNGQQPNQLQPNFNSNSVSAYNTGGNSTKVSPSDVLQNQQQNSKENPQHQTSTHQQASKRELLEEKWEIDGDEITREERIGQGSFATVYKGNWFGPVALKELNVKDPTPAQLQDFKNEVVVLKKTRHANVLLFVGYVLKPELIIVTQWCKGRSLYKHLHVEDRREFTNCQIHNIAMGVAQGMEYLHAKTIIHRDLKSNSKYRFASELCLYDFLSSNRIVHSPRYIHT